MATSKLFNPTKYKSYDSRGRKSTEVHILNGDVLKEQFPSSIPGQIVVARECLVDGNVSGNTLEELFSNRANFIQNAYGESADEYRSKAVTEFEKIRSLPTDKTVNLWFEDDLFCQVNLWFVAHLIFEYSGKADLFLIRPTAPIQYGFGGMDADSLVKAYQTRQKLSAKGFSALNALWKHYQAGKYQAMGAIAEQHKDEFPFLPAVVRANQERFPSKDLPGRPRRSLKEIMDTMGSDKFGPVFREFIKREAIYGFGDLQVKRMFEEIKNND